jgi:hypothetical protein
LPTFRVHTVCPADFWQQDNFANEEKQFCSLGEFGGFLPDKERCKKPYIPRLFAAFCCRQGQENATAAAAGAAVLEAVGLFCLRVACKKRRDGGKIQNSYDRSIFLDQQSGIISIFGLAIFCLSEARVLGIGHRTSPPCNF